MLETSKDLLYLVIAFAVLWLTVFFCWAMYYVISMLRNMSKITISVREKLELVDKILKLVKEKLEKGSNHMAVLADSAIKLVGFFMEKQKKTSAKKKK
ncbi:MAG: hypothetical protein A3A24_01820 [Candidatus Buchananbacteria bacterium RIFCSPLOWO2_01_FULL_46_12]|uniref:Uncharacterized protein n=2 Tax=Candidatus Buchananiibacteriota TaxID=1817903 RepID=A0A1G1YQE6_9BACT|nr:MAG: hypothetical protein A2744_00420 [Candidatus Buchananbacteria bacterium RIFCSPHIGHO2_01_FULL_44_11]OGY53657.1 MAG: hypothetical protein A3A24_01820 [Candidatus Buchananbacteria bacterium RIFCSPLOWO2_01_FULL_46_12]